MSTAHLVTGTRAGPDRIGAAHRCRASVPPGRLGGATWRSGGLSRGSRGESRGGAPRPAGDTSGRASAATSAERIEVVAPDGPVVHVGTAPLAGFSARSPGEARGRPFRSSETVGTRGARSRVLDRRAQGNSGAREGGTGLRGLRQDLSRDPSCPEIPARDPRRPPGTVGPAFSPLPRERSSSRRHHGVSVGVRTAGQWDSSAGSSDGLIVGAPRCRCAVPAVHDTPGGPTRVARGSAVLGARGHGARTQAKCRAGVPNVATSQARHPYKRFTWSRRSVPRGAICGMSAPSELT